MKLKILFFFFILRMIAFPQVLLRNAETDAGTLSFAREFNTALRTELATIYKLYAYNQEIKNITAAAEEYSYHLNSTYNKRLSYNMYEIAVQVTSSRLTERLFDLKVKVYSLSDGLFFTYADSLLPKDKVSEIAGAVKNILTCKIPAYLFCSKIQGEKIFFETTIKSLEENELSYDLLDQKGVVIGKVDPEFVTSGIIEADIDFSPSVDVKQLTCETIYLRSFKTNKELNKGLEILSELRDDEVLDIAKTEKEVAVNKDRIKLNEVDKQNLEEKSRTENELRKNDWITLSLTNLHLKDETMGRYYSDGVFSGYKPLQYTVQVNLAKTETRPYIMFRSFIPAERNFTDSLALTLTHKYNGFQAGAGLEKRFFLWNFLNPGLGIQLSYLSLSDEVKQSDNVKVSNPGMKYSALIADIVGSLSVRVGSYAPFASLSVGYGRYSNSLDDKTSWNASFAASLGVSIFF